MVKKKDVPLATQDVVKRGKGWKTLKIKFEGIPAPTLGDIRDLARALVDAGIAKQLSVPRFNLCCVLASLMLTDELVNTPIYPKSRLKRKRVTRTKA